MLNVLESIGNSVSIQGWVARWYPNRSTEKIIRAIVKAFDKAIAFITTGKDLRLEYYRKVTTKKST